MEIVLGHTSSMEFWRAKRSHSQTRALLARRGEPRSFRSDSPDVAKPSAGDLERLERIGLAQHANPAHFIVPNALSRVRTARITCSVFDRRIPSSAFVNVGDGVFVASPELCLLLEARTAALANLVETGYEFCGRYRLPALPDGKMSTASARREKPFRTYSRIRNRPKNRSFPCSAAFRDASAATGFPRQR